MASVLLRESFFFFFMSVLAGNGQRGVLFLFLVCLFWLWPGALIASVLPSAVCLSVRAFRQGTCSVVNKAGESKALPPGEYVDASVDLTSAPGA